MSEHDVITACLNLLRQRYNLAVDRYVASLISAPESERELAIARLVSGCKWVTDTTYAAIVELCSVNADAWRNDLGDETSRPNVEDVAFQALTADLKQALAKLKKSNGDQE
jgi:hypothetical protein